MEKKARERIVDFLKGRPEGMTIQEVAFALGVSRITASKYVYGLVSEDAISQRRVGPAKLCYMEDGNA